MKRNSNLVHYIPLWVVACCALVLMLMVYSGFRVWLYQSTADTTARLTELTQVDGEPISDKAISGKERPDRSRAD